MDLRRDTPLIPLLRIGKREPVGLRTINGGIKYSIQGFFKKKETRENVVEKKTHSSTENEHVIHEIKPILAAGEVSIWMF